MARPKKFNRFAPGSGSYVCKCCGKLTRETGEGESDVELCRACYVEAGEENFHMDHHDMSIDFKACPLCHPEVKHG